MVVTNITRKNLHQGLDAMRSTLARMECNAQHLPGLYKQRAPVTPNKMSLAANSNAIRHGQFLAQCVRGILR